MEKAIEQAVNLFLEKTSNKSVKIISHFDTDGITSAAIFAKALKKIDKPFTIKILKQLEKESIKNINPKKNEVLVFLDLASSSLEELSKFDNDIFILDHHEISSIPGSNITIINPHLFNKEQISAAGVTYLFCKCLSPENKELASLGVIGMVGDMVDKELGLLNKKIIEDAEVIIKRGLMLYPATRPIHKTLEFSPFFIPGVTGNSKGVISLLNEVGIKKENGEYKNLIELSEEELSKLLTAILIRTNIESEKIIGNIYLVKFFNKLEDTRELSALINACSRLGHSNVALSLCLNHKKSVKDAETIYAEYKQHLMLALNYADQNKIEGKGYVILNARDKIKETIIGTVASIMSMSRTYEEGTVIVALAHFEDKVKVSARIVGRNGRNMHELLQNSIININGECGGHPQAAGCFFSKEHEIPFLENLIKNLELETVKI